MTSNACVALGMQWEDVCEKGEPLNPFKMSWSQGKSCGTGKCREWEHHVIPDGGKPSSRCLCHLPHASLPAENNVAVELWVVSAQGNLRDLSIAPEKWAMLVTQSISASRWQHSRKIRTRKGRVLCLKSVTIVCQPKWRVSSHFSLTK